ncbi:MAG: hypothetical protein ACI9UN_001097 [Granulosicoccus sp.]|jgi:hypothetical protein
MPRMFFTLDISATEYQACYRGVGHVVVTPTEDGKRLQFPANELRKFVSHTGIQGRFEITFSSDNKLLDLRKVR